MRIGVQFTATLQANSSGRWFSHSWPQDWNVVWNFVSTSPGGQGEGPQVEWDVEVERTSDTLITYWLTVRNLVARPINFEARYVILN